MPYQYRTIESKLKSLEQQSSLIGLKGPSGAGKTTLLVNLFPDYEYINLDDPRTRMRLLQDPNRFIRQLPQKAILDEIQHTPTLLNALTERGESEQHFICISSCLFQQIRHVNIAQLSNMRMATLLPFQQTEVPNQLREQSIYCGGFPAVVSQQYRNCDDFFAEYIQETLIKQLPAIGMVSDPKEFQRLLHLLAAHTAQPINMSYYAKRLSVDVKTIKRWLELLASSFVIFLVPAYPDDFGKRSLKSPKLYFYDTGLVSYLTGIETMRQFEFGPLSNAIFENYVVMEILKKTLYEQKPGQFFYYATNHGVSVDLIIQRDNKRQMICIHFNETFRLRMLYPLETFKEDADQGYLIYNGIDMPYAHNIQINNVSTYLHSN